MKSQLTRHESYGNGIKGLIRGFGTRGNDDGSTSKKTACSSANWLRTNQLHTSIFTHLQILAVTTTKKFAGFGSNPSSRLPKSLGKSISRAYGVNGYGSFGVGGMGKGVTCISIHGVSAKKRCVIRLRLKSYSYFSYLAVENREEFTSSRKNGRKSGCEGGFLSVL